MRNIWAGRLGAGIGDALSASYGVNSLRYAMVIVSLIGTAAIPLYYAASRYLEDDLAQGGKAY